MVKGRTWPKKGLTDDQNRTRMGDNPLPYAYEGSVWLEWIRKGASKNRVRCLSPEPLAVQEKVTKIKGSLSGDVLNR